MGLEVSQVGIGHKVGHIKLEQSMHKKTGIISGNGLPGAVVYQERILDFQVQTFPFLNDTFGIDMNQNVTFGGNALNIHNGGTTTGWTGTAIAGVWNFADGGNITITSGLNNEAASFTTTGSTDTNNYTAFTGKIDLDVYDATRNDISLQCMSASINIGDAILLNDLIDVGDFGEQTFTIPTANFNFATTIIDELDITIIRTGGAKPTVKFDDFQWEETGTPEIFSIEPLPDQVFHITELRIAIANDITGIITVASGTENATMIGLSYNSFFGLGILTNGVIYSRTQGNKTIFTVILREIQDALFAGSELINCISDGTNSFCTLRITFIEPIILRGASSDILSFTINDNLSSLLEFKAIARGVIEI